MIIWIAWILWILFGSFAISTNPSLISFSTTTRDPLLPNLWGELKKGEDPYAPPETSCCVGECCGAEHAEEWCAEGNARARCAQSGMAIYRPDLTVLAWTGTA